VTEFAETTTKYTIHGKLYAKIKGKTPYQTYLANRQRLGG
jgi:hypothetical protein